MEDDLSTFAGRFAYALKASQLTRAQFTRLLSGRGQQKMTNWLKRGRIGSPSRFEVLEITGASVQWINDGVGKPFPTGAPVVHEAPQGGHNVAQLAAALARIAALDRHMAEAGSRDDLLEHLASAVRLARAALGLGEVEQSSRPSAE